MPAPVCLPVTRVRSRSSGPPAQAHCRHKSTMITNIARGLAPAAHTLVPLLSAAPAQTAEMSTPAEDAEVARSIAWEVAHAVTANGAYGRDHKTS